MTRDAEATIMLASALAVAVLYTSTGYAQSAAAPPAATDASNDSLQEIVVTARKRSEGLQTTPVSVSAFTSRDLETHDVRSIENLSAQTPSLVFQQSPYDPVGAEIGIRGQQATETIITQTPPVGVYIDDVYYPTTLAVGLQNFEGVQQVEVLKGPQGTLYGRNTTGGAVRITTQLPDYSGVNGNVKVGYGNHNEQSVSTAVNLPIVDQRVALNLVGQYSKDNGYGRNLSTGQDLQQNKSYALRAALRLDLSDKLQVIVRSEWARARGTQNIEDLRYVSPGFSIGAAAVAAQIGALTPVDYGILGGLLTTGAPPAGSTPAQVAAFFADVNKGRAALASYLCPVGSQCRNVSYPTPASLAAFGLAGAVPMGQDSTVDLSTVSVAGTYQFNPNFYLKSISAYQSTRRVAIASTSASPFLLIDGIADEQDPHQITQELQLGGDAFDGKLKWVGGYYYFDLEGYDNGINAELVPLLPNPVSNISKLMDTSNSGYGQVTYALTSTLNATVGARYTSERTTLDLGNRNAIACDVDGVPASATGAACSNSFPNSFSKLSYTAGLDWELLDHLMVYAKTSTGFRAGGTNQRSNPALDYAPENLTDYEIGSKSEWFDRRLRVNAAVYHSNYKDIQRNVGVLQENSFISEVQNAASAKINGVELEITARPVGPLTLAASAAYTVPKYVKYTGASATGEILDLSHNSFPNVSKWQGDVSANYAVSDSLGDFNATIDYAFRSTVDYVPDNHDDLGSGDSVIQKSYGLLNARISQGVASSKVVVGIWGKNLANRQYSSFANDFAPQLGYAYTIPGLPRTFGIDVRLSY